MSGSARMALAATLALAACTPAVSAPQPPRDEAAAGAAQPPAPPVPAPSTPVPPAPAACAATAPADLEARPIRWLGACIGSRADGLGVLRLGPRDPHEFFVGRMRAGRPDMGLVIQASGVHMAAMAFDVRGQGIPADAEHLREQDEAYAVAVRAARSTADRLAAAGHAPSAAWYRAFATRIETGRSE